MDAQIIFQLGLINSMIAEMESIKAELAGMVAQNEYRKCREENPEYTFDDFEFRRVQLDGLVTSFRSVS